MKKWIYAALFAGIMLSCGEGKGGILYLVDEAPLIDGDFSEYEGMSPTVTTVVTGGTEHVPEDAEGAFVLLSDGEKLFIYADVTDDVPKTNHYAADQGWQGDSVEIFIGTDVSEHASYKSGDNQIRIVPRKKDDIFAYDIAINEVFSTPLTEAAVVYSETGYRIEAAIPLEVLNLGPFADGQPIRCEFQVNDNDEGDRDRIVHWQAPKDEPWCNAASWADGVVKAF